MFVPYVPPGKFDDAIKTCDDIGDIKDYKCIFAHQEFYGAKMGAIISKDGDKWPLHNPLVVSGHIHDYQRPQENIIYIGTPMQHAFGDNTKKTISILTINNISEECIENRITLG